MSLEKKLGVCKTSDLYEMLECPVCFDYILPFITQCRNGHPVCNNCSSRLPSCPTCRVPFEKIRNIALEKIANLLKFPCKFSSMGCNAPSMHPAEKEAHEDGCHFRTFNCPCPGVSCSWTGYLGQVLNHLLMIHELDSTVHEENDIICISNIYSPLEIHWVSMHHRFGFYFMLVVKKWRQVSGKQQYGVGVLFIGSQRQSYDYCYFLEFVGPDKIVKSDRYVPTSIANDLAIRGPFFGNIDRKFVKLFEQNDVLTLKLRIVRL